MMAILRRSPKQETPAAVLDRFEEHKRTGIKADRKIPLMPKFDPGGFFRTRWAIKKIRVLRPGVMLDLLEVRMKGDRPWYRVQVAGTVVTGWINTAVLEGMFECR